MNGGSWTLVAFSGPDAAAHSNYIRFCAHSQFYIKGKTVLHGHPALFHGNKVPAGHVAVQLDSMFPRIPEPQCGHMFRLMEAESVPFPMCSSQKDASLSPGLLLFPWPDEEGAWGSCPGLTGGSPMLWMAEPPTSSRTACLSESKTNLTLFEPCILERLLQ